MSSDHRPSAAIVGGGITGLAAAHRLTELCPTLSITLFEGADRLGGVIQTTQQLGLLAERSADSFIASPDVPWAKALCERIGFSEELIGTRERHRRALVWFQGQLHPVPAGFQLMASPSLRTLWGSRLLSTAGKLRLCCEPYIRARNGAGDESLTSFATRRLGREAFERLVQPLVSGIFTADPDRLSMRAALPQFVAMEQEYGSLVRAARSKPVSQEASGARYGLFLAPRHGLSSLIEALARRLTAVHVKLRTPVRQMQKGDAGGWTLIAGSSTVEAFDAVILAVGARDAAKLLATVSPTLSQELAAIEHASSSVVCVAYDRQQVRHPLDAFGCVVPRTERRRILALSFASQKFSGRAPDGSVLLRAFVGGALQPELARLDDSELGDLVQDELAELLGVRGSPFFLQVARWPEAMPQYHLGHVDRVGRIEANLERLQGLALAGNALHGVGIPHCIRSGEAAAERLAAQMHDHMHDHRIT